MADTVIHVCPAVLLEVHADSFTLELIVGGKRIATLPTSAHAVRDAKGRRGRICALQLVFSDPPSIVKGKPTPKPRKVLGPPLSREQKIEVVRWMRETGGTPTEAIRHFGLTVDPRTVRAWRSELGLLVGEGAAR